MVQKCIRLEANAEQISSCKGFITQVDDESLTMVHFFGLIGSPMRFRILLLLRHEGNLCVCDLSDILEISIPGVSQHLRKLRDGGLVNSRKEGQTIYYALTEDAHKRLTPVFDEICSQTEVAI